MVALKRIAYYWKAESASRITFIIFKWSEYTDLKPQEAHKNSAIDYKNNLPILYIMCICSHKAKAVLDGRCSYMI